MDKGGQQMTIEDLKERLEKMNKADLGYFPTPLVHLDRMSQDLGVDLYIKRDDFTGRCLFGGNKTRKLQYLLGKALKDGADTLVTYGASQSNHAMQTAWAAKVHDLQAVLFLAALVEPDPEDYRANLLLDRIFDTDLHLVTPEPGEDFASVERRSVDLGRAYIKDLEAQGRKVQEIPMGGADPVGSLGYVEGFLEVYNQAKERGLDFKALYHACGSGGTMAGLMAGKKALESSTAIESVLVLDSGDSYGRVKAQLANESLHLLGLGDLVKEEDFHLRKDFYAPGYERPNAQATEAIQYLARTEGILLDPVYTGKAFSCLLHDIREGRYKKGDSVVFLHTGGATALFSEKEIIGNL